MNLDAQSNVITSMEFVKHDMLYTGRTAKVHAVASVGIETLWN